MRKKKKILVFPCGSEIGLDIYKLVRYSTYFNLVGASSVKDHGQFVYDRVVNGVPYVTDPQFVEAVRRIVSDYDIDAIYPTMDLALSVLKRHEPELGCRVIGSPEETVDICLSKELTYRALEGCVPLPGIFAIDDDIAFPVIVKPKIGYGGRGVAKIDSREGLSAYAGRTDEVLICEYLPGEEYTVDCFTDRHGCLRYAAPRRRNRVKAGISVNTTFVEADSEFMGFAEGINKALTLRGAWFFQVKRDAGGRLKLLEVAARFGGSSLLSNAKGVNLAQLSLFDAFDMDVAISPSDAEVELDRALSSRFHTDIDYDTVYVDFDDCLLLDGNHVNVELVAFLYQCVNDGKRLVLLTKHRGDLWQKLKAWRLEGLFDEVKWIKDTDRKSLYIAPGTKAIFIDDSFAEREEIRKNCGIPVLSLEMVEMLMK